MNPAEKCDTSIVPGMLKFTKGKRLGGRADYELFRSFDDTK